MKNEVLFLEIGKLPKRVSPENGKKFSLKELQGYVGGLVEFVPLPSGKLMVVNEEGKLDGLPVNENATAIFKKEYPKRIYALNNDELVVGNALVGAPNFFN